MPFATLCSRLLRPFGAIHSRAARAERGPGAARSAVAAAGVLLLAGMLGLGAGPSGVAGAAAPATGASGAAVAEGTLRLPGPGGSAQNAALPVHPLAAAAARRDLDRQMAGWALTWEASGGGRLTGQGKVAPGGAPAGFAAGFVRDHGALLGLAVEDLVEVDVRRAGRIEHRYYRQTHRGLPVEGSRLSFAFGRDGSALYFSARTAPGIALADTRPVVTLERARARAMEGLRPAASLEWDEGTLVILPARFSGLGGDRLAWRLRSRTEGPVGVWRMLVDARTGELLERESLLVQAGQPGTGVVVAGQVDGWVRHLTPFGAEQLVGHPHQAVLAYEGATLVGQTLTGGDGAFSFGTLDLTDPAALAVRAVLAGPYAAVYQNVPPRMPAVMAVHPADPGAVTLTWDDDVALPASRAVYVHVNTAHDRLKRIDPGFALLDRPVTIIANDSTGACNAFASLSPEAPRMTFYAANGPCPDIAEIADVVYHEYGHLATMYVYLPEWAPSDLHEAFSDYFATTIVDTNLVGLDFYGEGTHLREMDNDYVWPREECGGEEHCEGEVLAGVLWHMRENLIAASADREEAVTLSDSLFHYLRYGRPMDVHECLVQALLQDDDDDDLSNGTPHLEPIAAAFERHQIGDFAVHISHAPLFDTEDPTSPRAIEADLRSIHPLAADSVRLHYAVDRGPYQIVTMAGSHGHYSAQIPALPLETTVHYYLTAVDESGRRARLPAGEPDVLFQYVVGTDRTPPQVAHEQPGDPPAVQERLWLTAQVADNIGIVDSVRARVSVAAPGSNWSAWVDLQAKDEESLPGLYEGSLARGDWEAGTEVSYHFVATDGSSQANQTRYPATGEFTLETRRGRGWDFESDPAGLTLTGDWAWGATQAEPAPAPSGTQLAATVLDDMYNSGIASELTTVELDLSQWERALLEFRSWYWTEDEWDGGRVLASRDHGETWELLVPAGGYPGAIHDSETGSLASLPAFTGEGRVWELHQAPLDAYVGGPLLIRFRYWSDTSVVRLGWYLDDIKVIEAQALVAPGGLDASWAEDGQVTLHWDAPVGIDTGADEFLGYHIYRTGDPQSEPVDRITPEPLAEPEYHDTAVTNGVHYRYGVAAVYASGESPLGETVVGYPYRATLATAAAVELDIEGVAAVHDTLVVANAGTGELQVELHLGDAEDTFDDLVPRHWFDGVDDEEYALLAADPTGALAPDLTGLWCREQMGGLALKFDFAGPLSNPLTDYTLVGYLDTDLSRATGMPVGELGADYFFAMGALVYQQAGLPAFLMRALDAENVFPLAVPPYLVLAAGETSAEVGAPLELLGSPGVIGFAAQVMPVMPEPGIGGGPAAGPATPDKGSFARLRSVMLRALEQARPRLPAGAAASAGDDSTGDFLPNPREIDWLTVGAASGLATPEAPLNVPLDFDLAGRDPGELAARLFLTSNDQEQELVEIPIRAHIWYLPPAELSLWTTTCREDGLLLEWAPSEPEQYDAFLLARWGEGEQETAAVPVGGGPITAADDSLYRHLDRGVESGCRYHYRLTGLKPDGASVALSPAVSPIYVPAPATRLTMEAPRPNPFRRSTAFRMHVPAGTNWDLLLVDVSGRMVRRLVPRTAGEGEVQMVEWDGLTEGGTPVGQGVYYAVARAGGRTVVRPVVLIK